jgi:hypothetical protein
VGRSADREAQLKTGVLDQLDLLRGLLRVGIET